MTRNFIVFVIGALGVLQAVDAAAQPRWGRERVPQAGACFYEDRNFQGKYFCVQPGEDLRRMPRGMGDTISSLRLFGGSEVTVFRDSDMRGRSARFISNEPDLRRDGLNDSISSIVVAWTGYGYDARGRARGRTGNGGYYGNGGGYDEDWRSDRSPAWGRGALPREGACFY